MSGRPRRSTGLRAALQAPKASSACTAGRAAPAATQRRRLTVAERRPSSAN